MLVNTFRFGRTNVPLASIYGRIVLRVLAYTAVPAADNREAGWIGEGWLLIWRHGKYAIYESIEAALRGYRKAVNLYGNDRRGELAALAAMHADANQFVHEVTDRSRLDSAAQKSIESLIAGSASMLAGASNEHKAAARANLRTAASSVDRTGRRNPGSRRLCLAQAGIRFVRRVKEIKGILRNLDPWLAVVGEYHRECTLSLREIKGLLEYLLASREARWCERGTVHRLCKHATDRAGVLGVEPFLNCRDRAVGFVSQARDAARRSDFVAVKRSLCRALMSVRIGLAHVYLEGVRAELELLAIEYNEPGSDRVVVHDLIMLQRDKLALFLKTFEELDDADMGVRTHAKVKELVTGVVASLGIGGKYEFNASLGQAVSLL